MDTHSTSRNTHRRRCSPLIYREAYRMITVVQGHAFDHLEEELKLVVFFYLDTYIKCCCFTAPWRLTSLCVRSG